MTPGDAEITEEKARDVLGLEADKLIIQFTDEELRMVQDIMRAEQKRRADLFDNLLEKIVSVG